MTQFVLAVGLGALFAAGTFLILRRDVVRVVWGVALMSQGANVYLVTMGGVAPEDVAPIVHEGASGVTDPLVQALVLTAIVIGFGTTAFALVLTFRVYQEHGTVDTVQVGREDALGPAAAPAADAAGDGPADGATPDPAGEELPESGDVDPDAGSDGAGNDAGGVGPGDADPDAGGGGAGDADPDAGGDQGGGGGG